MNLLLLTFLLCAQPGLPTVQDPNEPGLLDPVIQHFLSRPLRLPGTDQVAPPSEQINIVGKVSKKKADKGKSIKGKPISSSGTQSPNQDVASAVQGLHDASASGDLLLMEDYAQELQAVLLGNTEGRIYDGFSLINRNRTDWLPEHVADEYKSKRAVDLGRKKKGVDGQMHTIWEVHVNLLYFDEEIDTDTYFLLFPPQADFRDHLRIHYTLYSTCKATFAPTTLLHDFDPIGAGRLPSKGYDAVWTSLAENQITEIVVDQGGVGNLRGVQIWNYRASPDSSVFLQPVWESYSANGDLRRDPRGTIMMKQLAAMSLDQIGDAAPEMKILAVAEAVIQGASAASIQDAMTSSNVSPMGTYLQWLNVLKHRNQLPQEALAMLAQEGIDPAIEGLDRLGPYDAILVYANQELYLDAAERLLSKDPFAVSAAQLENDSQGGMVKLKVINLDRNTHYLQSFDYGPPLSEDMLNCYYAPGGWHSLEIFVDQPVQGAPKMAELQWRLGWGLRHRLGTVEQFDIFTQSKDWDGLAAFTDERGDPRMGWQYPPNDRNGDWRVYAPSSWLGLNSIPLLEDGLAGVTIGRGTAGYGIARMPQGDLSAAHPTHRVNHDSDGDGIEDALIFPNWLRNPDPQQGDLIPATPLWEPFLYLNPADGSIYQDAQNPSLGLWAELSFAFGEPLPAGSNRTVHIRRPRSLGQALWHADGLYRESTGAPSRTWGEFNR